MEIKFKKELEEKILKEAEDQFRTPELQICFILSEYYKHGGFASRVATGVDMSGTFGSAIDFPKEELAEHLAKQKKFKNDLTVDEKIANLTLHADIDEDKYTENFSSARKLYEQKQAQDNKKLKPSAQHVKDLKEASKTRAIKKGKIVEEVKPVTPPLEDND